jgi:hypothetical protein
LEPDGRQHIAQAGDHLTIGELGSGIAEVGPPGYREQLALTPALIHGLARDSEEFRNLLNVECATGARDDLSLV